MPAENFGRLVILTEPSWFADESNYLKLVLAPLRPYRPLSWFRRVPRPT
jgi:hypothetical protein